MSTTDSRLGYIDCFELMDKAIEDPKGVRLKFGKYGDAWYFRLRLHNARRIDRLDNRRTYADSAHPMHGRSVYDDLIVKLQRIGGTDEAYLSLLKTSSIKYEFESLTDVEENEEEFVKADASQEEEVPAPVLANQGVVGIKRRF